MLMIDSMTLCQQYKDFELIKEIWGQNLTFAANFHIHQNIFFPHAKRPVSTSGLLFIR